MTNPAPYTALARRYRPQTFDEVVGQGHVAQALRNALRKDRVSHAYLFTGARGVGKTSTARIFAKALNCPNAVDAVPCNECDVCESIARGGDLDVVEIDAASNRGIDDVRQLREGVRGRPTRSKFKIYIVDEAHQLSRDAWNALLKTLEEPPPHVKFFFCTTEPTKLPDTILSRCQRFDFSTVETTNIVARLEQIATSEGFSVEPAALELVARRAAGSMRDSQSLFDQLLAFGSEKISVADVHRLFGTADDDRLIAVASAMADRQPGRALTELGGALDAGIQLGELFDQLIGYFRDLMVLAAGAEGVSLVSVAEDRRDVLAEQAGRLGLNTLLAGTQILSETRQRMQRAAFARPLAELAVARVSLLNDLDDLADLIAAVRSAKVPAPGGTRRAPAPSHQGPRGDGEAAVAPLPPQKKSSEVAAPAPRPAAPAPPNVPFEIGNEAALLSQLQARAGVELGMHLVRATRAAILGPNALELAFPARYSAARQQIEGAGGRGRLEQLLAELTGRQVKLSCRLIEEDAAAEPGPARPRAVAKERQRPAQVPEEDDFVLKAVNLFEAKVLKVTELGGPSGE